MLSINIMFTEQQRDAILNYRYKGSDTSYMYIYVYSPLAELGVKYTPLWVAPNVITLGGFLLLAISHMLIAYYSWDFNHSLPSYVCVIAAVNYFAYQVLDNMDGKQARKTISSSPLGMMFDHGCDAVGSMLSTCSFLALAHTTSPIEISALSTLVFSGFYLETLKTYHICEMNLEKFNAVTDGSVLIILSYLITAVAGDSFWRIPIITVCKTELNFATIIYIAIIIAQIKGGVIKNIKSIQSESQYKPISTFSLITENLMAILLLAVAAICLLSGVMNFDPRLVLYCIGSMYTIMDVKTLLFQVIKTRLPLYVWQVLVGCVMLIAYSLLYLCSAIDASNLVAIRVCTLFCMGTYAIYHLRVLKGLRDTLGIKAFSIEYKKE